MCMSCCCLLHRLETSCQRTDKTNDPLRESSQFKFGLLQWGMALTQPSQLVRGAGFNQNTKMVEINAWQQFWGFGRNCIRQWTPPGRQSDCLCLSSFSNQQTPSWCQGCTSWGWSGRCQGCLHPMQYQTKPPWDVLQFCIIHWINGNLLVSSVKPIWMWSIKLKGRPYWLTLPSKSGTANF